MNLGVLLEYLHKRLSALHASCVGFAIHLQISLHANCSFIRVQSSKQGGVLLELLESGLDRQCCHAFCPFQTAFRDEAFDLARVGLVFDVLVAPSNYAVKCSASLGVELARPESEPMLILSSFATLVSRQSS